MIIVKSSLKTTTHLFFALIALSLCLVSFRAQATSFQLSSPNAKIVGQLQQATVKKGDTLSLIARRHDLGYYQILEANASINPQKLKVGQQLLIPSKYILPNNVPHKGIIINLAELRLYYFSDNGKTVFTAPVGIGRVDWGTPLGNMKIIQMVKHPYWFPPASVRKDVKAKYNMNLPKAVPPGPNNPLGEYKIRLSRPTYLIHGTNSPKGVGRRVSAGCIRMYPEDIKTLYGLVKVGTEVHVINQPYKVAKSQQKLYLEAHKPLAEMRKQYGDNMNELWVSAVRDAISEQQRTMVNWQKAAQVSSNHHGIPDAIAQLR